MPILVGQGTDYAKIPPPKIGPHHAVCAEVYDRGICDTDFGKKHKIWIIFQVDEITEGSDTERDGTHKEVWVGCNLALGPRTTLRKHLESWRGEPLEEDDFDENHQFDLEKLIGIQATINIGSWSEPNENGQRYPNDINILPPNDPSVQLVGENEMEITAYVPLDERKKQNTDFPPAGEAAKPAAGKSSGGKPKDKKPDPF